MRVKTTKERQQRKARNKANQELQTKAPKFDVAKLFQALNEANDLITKLKKKGESMNGIASEVLEEMDKRLTRIENEIFKSDDQRGCDTAESPGADDAESGGGVPVPPLQETNEDIQEVAALGDGTLSD